MRAIKQTLFLLLISLQLSAQNGISLDQCQRWAHENHPVLQQKHMLEKVSALSVENLQTAWLPALNLNGQATYQSDVTSVPISLPNLTVPSAAKDQYKMYVDFSQTIWDGGITRTLTMLEKQKLNSELQKTEVEMYSIQEKVNRFFFLKLKLQQSKAMLLSKTEVLTERRKQIESAVRNGVLLSSELDQLNAELIRLDQELIGNQTGEQTCMQALAVLTGKESSEFAELLLPLGQLSLTEEINRPELKLFAQQRTVLDLSSDLLHKQRNPRFQGFGQLGYGKPGLNMLSNEFDTYYVLGVGMKWNITDWKKTQREKQSLQLQKQIVDTREADFRRNIRLASEPYLQEIEKLKQLLEKDAMLVELLEKITKTAASKLDHGTITVADYLRDLNAEVLAKIAAEMHRVQLVEAFEAYHIIQGK